MSFKRDGHVREEHSFTETNAAAIPLRRPFWIAQRRLTVVKFHSFSFDLKTEATLIQADGLVTCLAGRTIRFHYLERPFYRKRHAKRLAVIY